MKRTFDLFLSLTLLLILLLPILIISFLIKFTSDGPALFWSNRIGKNNKHFKMLKFRTMNIDAPIIATHLLSNPSQYLTPLGSFLRRTSLDEIPQLWNILKGDMSFVGPRPALFNQYDLIKLRKDKRIHTIRPGLTGWAQINGRDDLSIVKKVNLDQEYLRKKSFVFDFKILVITFMKIIQSHGIHH
jgi:O-antigen biosynthesis protein WbqP